MALIWLSQLSSPLKAISCSFSWLITPLTVLEQQGAFSISLEGSDSPKFSFVFTFKLLGLQKTSEGVSFVGVLSFCDFTRDLFADGETYSNNELCEVFSGLVNLFLVITIFLFDLLGVILTKLFMIWTLNSSKCLGDLLKRFLVGVILDDLLGVLLVLGLRFVGVIFNLFFSGVTWNVFTVFLELRGLFNPTVKQDTSKSSSSILMLCKSNSSFDFLLPLHDSELVSSIFLFFSQLVVGVFSFLFMRVKKDEIFFWFSFTSCNLQ